MGECLDLGEKINGNVYKMRIPLTDASETATFTPYT
jgi:hypothetical protein